MKRGSLFFALAVFAVNLLLAGPALADWETPVTVVEGAGLVMDSDLAEGPDGTLHFVWAQFLETGGAQIAYSSSHDGGQSWTTPVRLDQNGSGWDRVNHPDVSVSADGVIHVTSDYIHFMGAAAIRYFRSADGGVTWPQKASYYTRYYNWPYLSIAPSGNVFLSWGNWISTQVLFARSLDGGNTWSGLSSPVSGGWVNYGLGGYYAGEARSSLYDSRGALHIMTTLGYSRSFDEGAIWEPQTMPWPSSFIPVGLSEVGGDLLISGSTLQPVPGTTTTVHRPSFLRSSDGGATWQGPFTVAAIDGRISQIVGDGHGRYFTVIGNNPVYDQVFLTSDDSGATWNEPQSVPRGRIHELMLAADGSLWAALVDMGNPYWSGIVKYREPAGIELPEFLSVVEKATYTYRFKAMGSDTVELSFPAEFVEVDPAATVTVGSQTVPVACSTVGETTVITFPVNLAAWTECSLPIRILKGNLVKAKALQGRIAEEKAALAGAIVVDDADRILAADGTLQALEGEEAQAMTQIAGRVLLAGRVLASDATQVAVYDSETVVYAHFKAEPPNKGGASLIMLSSDAVTLGIWEPFRLEVKVTHLTQGESAQIGVAGQFQTLEFIESSETGAKKATYDLFYPPSFTGSVDTITISVTANGTTTAVPLTVNLR